MNEVLTHPGLVLLGVVLISVGFSIALDAILEKWWDK